MSYLRQRINFQSGVVSGTITNSQTTISGISFSTAIAAGSAVPVVLNPSYYGSTTSPEIIYVTSVSGTVATVIRAQEGTTNVAGTSLPWVAGPLASDFGMSNMVANGDVPGGSIPAGSVGYSGTNTQTGSYTVVSGDVNYLIQMTNTTSGTLTIPSSSAFAIGQQITAYRSNTGIVAISGAAGVTIVSTAATATVPTLRAQYSVATAINIGTNSWLVTGDLA